jgi:hypothetical protein
VVSIVVIDFISIRLSCFVARRCWNNS